MKGFDFVKGNDWFAFLAQQLLLPKTALSNDLGDVVDNDFGNCIQAFLRNLQGAQQRLRQARGNQLPLLMMLFLLTQGIFYSYNFKIHTSYSNKTYPKELFVSTIF